MSNASLDYTVADSKSWVFESTNPMFKQIQNELYQCFWFPDKVSYEQDYADFQKKLRPDEQRLLKLTIAEFLLFDSRIQRQLIGDFVNEIENPQVSAIYTTQAGQEVIHEQSYEDQFRAIAPSEDVHAVLQNPIFEEKIEWYNRYMTPAPYADPYQGHSHRILIGAIVEYLFFCGKFCLIYWFKTSPSGGPPGVIAANEYIARDENNHVKNALAYYHWYQHPLPDHQVSHLIQEACDLEIRSIRATYLGDLSIDPSLMERYIQYSANDLFQRITKSTGWLYPDVKVSPCAWMNAMTIPGKTNFFEAHTTNYKESAIEKTLVTVNTF